MRRVWITASMLVAALSTGCSTQGAYDEDDGILARPGELDRAYRPVRDALDGHVTGSIGPVAGLDHDAQVLTAYDDGRYLSVETVVALEDRAAMTLLSVSNGSDLLRPGLNATFLLDDFNTGGPQVTVLGCVGQDVGLYDQYDMPADVTTIAVEEGVNEGEMDVSLAARWYDRDPTTGARLATSRFAETRFTLVR